jgi:trimeric autotransporter adhesin
MLMSFKMSLRAMTAAMVLGLAACSGSNIASPGATNSGTLPGGGGTGGGGGGGGGATCPAGTTASPTALGGNTVCNVTGEILSNLTLPRLTGIVYRLNGRVDIGRDVGAAGNLANGVSATLTIEPGVRLFGDVAGDILIVNRGSRINAVGNAGQPIIFTSKEDIEGTVNVETSTRQWGGIVLLGRGPIRGCNTSSTPGTDACQNAIEGITAATGRDALYGGSTSADNSGTMRFVRISYSSDFLSSAAAGDDLNGLTLGGVGSGTDLSFIQVHNSGDDGVEWFGGTVNMRNVVVTGALDDSLDYDDGWTGNVQFAVVRQTLTVSGGPDRLIEASNITRAGLGGALNTNPTFSNFTFSGIRQNFSAANIQGISLNNTNGSPGSSGRFANGVVTGSNVCLAAGTANTSPAPTFNSIVFDCPTAPDATSVGFINAGANNSTAVANSLTNLMPGPVELGRAAVNPTTLGSFFATGTFVGAFNSTETVASNWTSGWTIQLFPAPACPAGTTESGTVAGQRRCIVSGTLGVGAVPASVRLVAGNIYQISGRVNVGNDLGADPAAPISGRVAGTLTIDAGVTLFGNAAGDMLVVNRGSQLFVNGTVSAPVIMTSLDDVTNGQVNPLTATREWGGLIIVGRAPIRGCNTAVAQGSVTCQNAIEGVTAATGADALYGGATATDNSGRITFLQIRYPGAFLTSAAAGDDLNGMTLGGVGSGTEISNVQVHNSGDDGVEIFGGTVNLRNIAITGALDDSFDLDEGWTGATQFLLVRQYLTVSGGPDRTVESSNRAVSSLAGTLNTNPLISNFTFVGIPQNFSGAAIQGVSLNNTNGTPGSSGRYANGVVLGSTTCLAASLANTSPAPTFNSVLFDCPGVYDGTSQGFITAGANNTTTTANSLTGGFINGATETGRTVVDPTTLSSFFVAAPYIGAVRNAGDTRFQTWTCGLYAGSSC